MFGRKKHKYKTGQVMRVYEATGGEPTCLAVVNDFGEWERYDVYVENSQLVLKKWKEEEIRRLAKAEIAKENLFWKRYKEKVKK